MSDEHETLPDRHRPIPERVADGAALLDKIRPGWHRKISLDRLNMATKDCILAQLWGDWKQGLAMLGLPRGKVAPGAEAVPYGFDLSQDMPRYDYHALTRAWRDLILERRERDGDLYYGLRDVIGVVVAGLEHTTVAELPEVQHAIAVLTDACALGDRANPDTTA